MFPVNATNYLLRKAVRIRGPDDQAVARVWNVLRLSFKPTRSRYGLLPTTVFLRVIENGRVREIPPSVSATRCESAKQPLSALLISASLLYAPESRLRFRNLVRVQQTPGLSFHFLRWAGMLKACEPCVNRRAATCNIRFRRVRKTILRSHNQLLIKI